MQALTPPLPEIHIDDEIELPLQQLYITATRADRSARSDASDPSAPSNRFAPPVLDLERQSFEIFDMGRRQKIVTFEHGDVPLTAVLLIDSSGGRRIEIQRFEDAAAAFQQVLIELRQQYVLGFYPERSPHDGAWHPIRIEVGRKGILLRTREGYYDDP